MTIPASARIVLVHDNSDFNVAATLALTVAGYSVAPFVDPVTALIDLEGARTIEALITRVRFGPDKPNGLALARAAQWMRPHIRVLFTVAPEFGVQAAGSGHFIASPDTPSKIVEGVRRLLTAADFSTAIAEARTRVDAGGTRPGSTIPRTGGYRCTKWPCRLVLFHSHLLELGHCLCWRCREGNSNHRPAR